jgi:hypothetical protein
MTEKKSGGVDIVPTPNHTKSLAVQVVLQVILQTITAFLEGQHEMYKLKMSRDHSNRALQLPARTLKSDDALTRRQSNKTGWRRYGFVVLSLAISLFD